MRIDWIGRIFLRMEVWKLRNVAIGRDSMIKRCSRPSISRENDVVFGGFACWGGG